jgi:hypothetical protein
MIDRVRESQVLAAGCKTMQTAPRQNRPTRLPPSRADRAARALAGGSLARFFGASTKTARGSRPLLTGIYIVLWARSAQPDDGD